jgi:hypothetical protein
VNAGRFFFSEVSTSREVLKRVLFTQERFQSYREKCDILFTGPRTTSSNPRNSRRFIISLS